MVTDTKDGLRVEELKVRGEELLDKVKELIHEGNIRRIIIKHESGETIVEIPLTVGVVGAVFAPALAAVGAVAALVTDCTITIERSEDSIRMPKEPLE